MAFYDTTWYCNFGDGTATGYYAVTVRPQNTAVAAGVLRRQFTAPAVGSERVFVCIVAGTTANTTDATWLLTRGSKTTDGTVTWQECTGSSAMNGDLTNTANWTTAKATAAPSVGAIIKRNNGASYQICTTAGAMGASEPAFSDTAGVTTTDSSAVWTSLGVVGNFSGGGAPFARLQSVGGTNWFTDSNTIYVGDNHAESRGSTMTITIGVANVGVVSKIICHNHSGSYPPAAGDITTGATISTTGAFSITFALNWFYIYGIAFKAGVGAASSGNLNLKGQSGSSYLYFDNCSFQIAATTANQTISVGGASSSSDTVYWNNCTVSFAATSQYVGIASCQFYWQNTGQVLVGGSSVPTRLLGALAASAISDTMLEALDLSQLTGALWANQASQGTSLFIDCKLHASATVPTPLQTQQTVQLMRCDSGATAYKSARYTYEGTETTETSITRVGGAVDPTGQAQSRKIVTTTGAQWLLPFKAEPYAIWNTVTGSNVTVTVYGTINAGAVPNNDELWLELEYLGSSATPLGTLVTTTKASFLATNAAVASDGSTWNGGGSGAGWSPFKLTKTLSSPQPGMVGYLHARVRAAKASTTYYLDPKVELS